MTTKARSLVIEAGANATLPPQALRELAAAAQCGKIIAFPTDTVYGLGSSALAKSAAGKIIQIKGRPALKPLPILIASTQAAKHWVQWTPQAEKLASRFWPGALTLVLRPTAEGRQLVCAESKTLAVRVPNNPLLLKIIAISNVPWVSTSANLSGSPALKDGSAVIRQFEGLVDYIIDAGDVPGVESTVVDATRAPTRVLRQGALWIN